MTEHRMVRNFDRGIPGYGCICGIQLEPGYQDALRGYLEHAESDGTDSLAAKRAGMKVALSKHDEWKDQFRQAVTDLVDLGEPFTSEDVVALVGLPTGGVGSNRNNAVGAMMNGLAQRKIIRKTGSRTKSKRATSHSAELVLWIGNP